MRFTLAKEGVFATIDYFKNTCLNAIKKYSAVAEMVCAYCILKFSVT